MTQSEVQCENCSKIIKVQIFSAGFNDVGVFTCDRDSTVLTVSVFDKKLYDVVGEHPKGAWTEEHFKKVEAQLINCPCGGTFKHDTLPKCPNCGALLRVRLAPSEYVVVGRYIQGEKQSPWRS